MLLQFVCLPKKKRETVLHCSSLEICRGFKRHCKHLKYAMLDNEEEVFVAFDFNVLFI